jgi:hypothetical protein
VCPFLRQLLRLVSLQIGQCAQQSPSLASARRGSCVRGVSEAFSKPETAGANVWCGMGSNPWFTRAWQGSNRRHSHSTAYARLSDRAYRSQCASTSVLDMVSSRKVQRDGQVERRESLR